jgi:hypothetical protein
MEELYMSHSSFRADAQLVKLVISCLESSSELLRNAALRQAQKMSKNDEIGTAVLSLLDTETEDDCKINAIKALAVHGTFNIQTQTKISSLMIDHQHDGKICVEAIRAFVSFGGEVSHVISSIILLLSTPGEFIYGAKNAVLNLLGELGARGNAAAPHLALLLLNEHEHDSVRSMMVFILRDIGATREQASLQLVKGLLSPKLGVPYDVLSVLPDLGVTKEAVPFLIESLNYKDPNTGQVRNRYPGLMFGGGIDMHEVVIDLLATLEKDAAKAIPVLEELLTRSTDDPKEHRSPAPVAYGGRGRPSKSLIPHVPKPTRFTSEKAKEAARRALEVIRA